jgi:putative ABC transport system permease protein
VAQEIDGQFHGTSHETRSESEGAFRQRLVPWANIKKWILYMSIPGIIAIFCVAISAAATAARRRSRELALLRVLGFENTGLLAMLICESLTIAVAGGTIGSIAAWSFHKAVSVSAILPMNVTLETICSGLALTLFAGVAGGLFSFFRHSRMTVTGVLRQVQ